MAWIATTGGYFWCAAEQDLHVDDPIDEVPAFEDDDEAPKLEQCLRMASIAEISWYTTFSLFWIPVGIILRRVILASDEQPRVVYGLSNAWAAMWVAIIPWTFGIMLIVWSGVVASALGVEGTQVYEDIYGAVVYHYGMVLGYFLFHNLAYSLPRDDEQMLPSSSASKNGDHNMDTEKSTDLDLARPY